MSEGKINRENVSKENSDSSEKIKKNPEKEFLDFYYQNLNQTLKESNSNINEIAKTKNLNNELINKKGSAFSMLEQVSSLSSFESSELSFSSSESCNDQLDNIVKSGHNENASRTYKVSDHLISDSHRCNKTCFDNCYEYGDYKFYGKVSNFSRDMERSTERKKSKDFDFIKYKYSPDRFWSKYPSSSYRNYSRWNMDKSRFKFYRMRCSQSLHRTGSYRDSESPIYRSKRSSRCSLSWGESRTPSLSESIRLSRSESSRRSRSESRRRSWSESRTRSRSKSKRPSRSRSRSRKRNRSRSRKGSRRKSRKGSRSKGRKGSRSKGRKRSRSKGRKRSRSRGKKGSRSRGKKGSRSKGRKRSRSKSKSFGSPKENKRDPLTKKKKLRSDSPIPSIWKLLDYRRSPSKWINRRQLLQSPPKPPPLPPPPPPPPLPPPPAENNTLIFQPQLILNNISKSFLPQPVFSRQNYHLQNLYGFPNPPLMPCISVNNLPLVPGAGNLPVHITPAGEQIVHDMDGRPIPVGRDGRLLPVDMSGRLYPHVVFPCNNQAIPIYMTEDGVLRLPNGEPVPYNPPDQLPVDVDGIIIPIGPDSRPLFPCPNIPRKNPFIISQGGDSFKRQNPVETKSQLFEFLGKSNPTVKKTLHQTTLSRAVVQIETVSDSKIQESLNSSTVTEAETDPSKQSGKDKSEELDNPQKPQTSTGKVQRKKFEDFDLTEIVEKLSGKINKINVHAIYLKKLRGNIKNKIKPSETEPDKKSGPGLETSVNTENSCNASKSVEKHSSTTPKENLPKDDVLSPEEVLSEKKFLVTLQEAISLFSGIDFSPPGPGRFLFRNSSINFTTKSSPNESPLLRNATRLPFISPENFAWPTRISKTPVSFRFVSQRNAGRDKRTGTSSNFAVQCDFTTRKIQFMHAKIENLRRELFLCRNENAELTELYKFMREDNKRKTEELKILRIMKKSN